MMESRANCLPPAWRRRKRPGLTRGNGLSLGHAKRHQIDDSRK